MKAIAIGLVWAGYALVVYGWTSLDAGKNQSVAVPFKQIVWPGAYTGSQGTTASATSSGTVQSAGSTTAGGRG